MPLFPHRVHGRRLSAPLVLLPSFAGAVLVLVVAVVVIAWTNSDLADAGAVALLLVFAWLMLAAIRRLLAEPDATEDDDEGGP